jgi:glycosyltransferase involved in cell wall biosynthesis
MEKEINLLHLSPRIPYPPDDGGKISIYNSLKFFKKNNINNTFVFFDDSEVNPNYINELKKYCDIYIFNHSTKNSYTRIIKSIIKNESIYIKKHSTSNFIDFLVDLHTKKKFNFTYVEHTCMAYPAYQFSKITGIKYGLKLNNVEWMIWKRYADNLSILNPKKYYVAHQGNLLKKEEANLIKQSSVSFAITDSDYLRARDLSYDSNIVKVPIGINIQDMCPDFNSYRNIKELIIATTFNWVHNVDAIKWFIDKVMPLVINEIPDVMFTIIGKYQPEWIKNLDKKHYNPVGYVEKVQPYLNKAGIYIAPLFVGSGVRIKILEAMSMGLPVVATDISAEGIKAGDNEGLFRANNPNEFAERIIDLIRSENKLENLRIKAREFIMNNHSWDIHIKMLIDEMQKLI